MHIVFYGCVLLVSASSGITRVHIPRKVLGVFSRRFLLQRQVIISIVWL